MEAILGFEQTTARAIHILEEFQSHDVVIDRLKRMKAERLKRESERDPFRKTILEKIRELWDLNISNKQHWIKAKLHWFAGSDWRRAEIEEEIDKKVKFSGSHQTYNPSVHYQSESADIYEAAYSGEQSEEYRSLFKEQADSQENNLDFNVYEQVISGRQKLARAACSEQTEQSGKAEKKKTTTELFLAVTEYVESKERKLLPIFEDDKKSEAKGNKSSELENNDESKVDFTPTRLWAQSDDYMPGEKWDPQLAGFEKLAGANVESCQEESASQSSQGDSGMIGFLLAQNNPGLFTAEAF